MHSMLHEVWCYTSPAIFARLCAYPVAFAHLLHVVQASQATFQAAIDKMEADKKAWGFGSLLGVIGTAVAVSRCVAWVLPPRSDTTINGSDTTINCFLCFTDTTVASAAAH
jgi:hypothetical protein